MLTTSEKVLLQWTVFLEAEGEPTTGKLGVAWVILNRMQKWKQSAYDVCWSYAQFSCWNENERERRIKRLRTANDVLMSECQKVVEGASGGNFADPTGGATYYLNVELTRKMRGGTLPQWVEAMQQTVVIGQHTFFKEVK